MRMRPARDGVAQLAGVVTIIHQTPKRSATIPKRGEKNVLPIGICTCPPSPSTLKRRSLITSNR
jgi:hypothetical protein